MEAIEYASSDEIEKVISIFGRLDVENLDHPNKLVVGILDKYNKALDEEEALRLISYEGHNIRYEKNFIEFVLRCIREYPDFHIFIRNFKSINNRELKKKFDSEEVKLVLNMKNSITEDALIKVRDISIVKLILSLSTREVFFSNFFFGSFVVLGNFDLSFPVYCSNKETFNACTKVKMGYL
ncbi:MULTISPECIES: hypothetical protein [unclassified Paenibacillus]|uniref:hypothetical protein n=1 Tax=unclassified Paenibacillus TaxID=185978 RepID=UPI00020D769E|nr:MULTISPECIES: hypothetical protein [unclassified Paenibacillus]EGL19899.1 hypothetical protein HMPREF9413_3297 [Paenibacillus sp. HGF7]EPD88608.1 hypothetical protein HMPREF1207_02037 [Paenibacillus sp. HGH0039]